MQWENVVLSGVAECETRVRKLLNVIPVAAASCESLCVGECGVCRSFAVECS